jgi:hypothetical protein
MALEWAQKSNLIREAQSQLDGILEIISGIETMFPDLKLKPEHFRATKPTDGPKGMEAALTVLKTYATRYMDVREVVRELETRGWLSDSPNPANGVRTALERLVSSPNNGVYKDVSADAVRYVYAPSMGDG